MCVYIYINVCVCMCMHALVLVEMHFLVFVCIYFLIILCMTLQQSFPFKIFESEKEGQEKPETELLFYLLIVE